MNFKRSFTGQTLAVFFVISLIGSAAVNTFSGSPDNQEATGIPHSECGIEQPLNFSGGPPNGRTGAPLTTPGTEPTCNDFGCHSSFGLNSGNGSYTISPPAEYLPGETLTVSIALEDPGQMRWGFELTVLDANNLPVGELIAVEATRTQKNVDLGSGREYIKHRSTGTDPFIADVAPGWTVQWVAPLANAGTVTFYGAGNAANNNGLNTGDFIYTGSASMPFATGSGCCNTPGDFTNDGSFNIADVTAGISRIFSGGPAASCQDQADANGDNAFNIADVTYGIARIFSGGPAPVCGTTGG